MRLVDQDDLEPTVHLDNLAHQETKDCVESLEMWDLKDLMDSLDLKVPEVRSVFQECPEKPDLQAHQDQLDHGVPQEEMELMDTKASQVKLD